MTQLGNRESKIEPKIRPVAQVVFFSAVALNAAGAMVVEITAGRLLAPYFGMSLYTWTTIIGIVLAGLTVGHWLGGALADRFSSTLKRTIALAFWAGALITLAILPITRFVALAMTEQQNPLAISIVVTSLAAFLLPSFAAGVIQPLATTYVIQRCEDQKGHFIGRMLAAGAFGSILGTFLAGFVLISYIGSAGSIWIVAGANALFGALFFMKPVVRFFGLVVGIGMGYAALSGWRVSVFATPCQVESQYYCIRIDPADHMTGRSSRLMALDHLVHSINDEQDPGHLASPYVHFVDEIARQKFGAEPFSAFFIGGGGYTLPRAWVARHPDIRMFIAEIDPKVTLLAKKKLWFEPRDGVVVANLDARFALASQKPWQKYDVIFGDAFHDIAVPAHLITDEFYRLVAERLTDRGFYILNLVDDPRRPRLLASVLRTMQKQFKKVEIWGAPDDLGGAQRGTFILYASKRVSGLPAKYLARNGQPRLWWRIGIQLERVERLGVMLTDDFAPVDRLLSRLWLRAD